MANLSIPTCIISFKSLILEDQIIFTKPFELAHSRTQCTTVRFTQNPGYFLGMEPIVPPPILASAHRFLELLDRWNATHALTALPPAARFEELIQDACALLPHLQHLPVGARLVDFGTGMGIPAVVLAMARPDLDVRAVDKSKKKIAFVHQVAMELGLANLTPMAGRAEELHPLEADLGTAKAVGDLSLLAPWWARHGRPGAPLLLLKGEGWSSEPAPAGWRMEVLPYRLPIRGARFVLRLVQEPGL